MSNFIPVIGEYYLIRKKPFVIAKLVRSTADFGMYESHTFENLNGDYIEVVRSGFSYTHVILPTIYKILNNVA